MRSGRFLRRVAAAGAAALACALVRAPAAPVPVIYSTDLMHPHDDPDDHFDLACLYAMPEADVRAIVLDNGASQAKRPGTGAVRQLNHLAGRAVPSAIGLSAKLKSPGDPALDQPRANQGGVELILRTLRESAEPVAIVFVGSARDTAAAFNREPALFRAKVRSIHGFIGEASHPDFIEYNVGLDPQAFARLMSADLPFHWIPCFDGGLWTNRGHASFWKVRHGDVLSGAPDPLPRYFLHMLRKENADPIAALYAPVTPADRAWLMAGPRNLWAGALLGLAVGRPLQAGGREIARFEPVDVTVDGRGVVRCGKAEGSHRVQRFAIVDPDAFPAAATAATAGLLSSFPLATGGGASGAVPDLGSRLELFADDFLVDRLEGCRLTLHEPHPAGVALRLDRPWEGSFCGYFTVLKDGGRFRMYYRGKYVDGADGSTGECTCCAESADGIAWTRPDLGLFEICGTRSNNVVLARAAPFSHNFAPFLDTRPGAPAAERFKALAGTAKSGLVAFVSGDGLRWRKLREAPVLTQGAFDSQNVAFWSENERCYVAYVRTFTQGPFAGYRTISRAMSTNFVDWTAPVEMSFGDTPREHLYTSETHPYFRAPHLYVATPMRFFPGRKALTDAQAAELKVGKGYAGDCADAVFMTSRGGYRYARTFMEAFIRPGPDLGNWASRAGLTALGVVPTGPAEMSVYKQAHYAQPSTHLLRFTLRTDGFASVRAPYAGGAMVTRPFRFAGRELTINFATSAAGSLKAEIQDADGRPQPGFALADAVEQIGDDLERTVQWRGGSDVSRLAGRPVRLRFEMKDADLYALRFRP